MTRHAPLAFSALAAFTVAGCASKPASRQVEAVDAGAPQGPVIVRLIGQHETITVTSGPNGPLYSAHAADGRAIVANASLERLRVDHPEVFRLVEPAVATSMGEDVKGLAGTVVDPRGRQLRSAGATSDRFLHTGR